MYKLEKNAVEISKSLIADQLGPGQIVVDATVGKGKDTLELARRVGPTGRVYGFDIQAKALEITRQILEEEGLENVRLIQAGHQDIDAYVDEEIDFAIYNLGYLPGGDKTIITNRQTTLTSLEKTLELLKPNGLVLVVCYLGHPGAKEEAQGVEAYLTGLDQRDFNVLRQEFINQRNYPPLVYRVEKNG